MKKLLICIMKGSLSVSWIAAYVVYGLYISTIIKSKAILLIFLLIGALIAATIGYKITEKLFGRE